ncbi:ATP-binding cassette domain-containing protein [Phaeovibrio sulfidiphilus]|uniref:ATP-binding cassette domain-containing protein n=1 Tax=Phaeovibrio sulfidiphilus TaxID=1220600 RepID=UPI003B8356D9
MPHKRAGRVLGSQQALVAEPRHELLQGKRQGLGRASGGGDEPVNGLGLTSPAGSYVAIVGPTGSGKRTPGYLLARLYEVEKGAVRFDGVDVRDLSVETLSQMLGVVSQDPYLLHASVAENLRSAKPDSSDAEVIAAARVAQIMT